MTAQHLFLHGPFVPAHADNRMLHEGDVVGARSRFLAHRFRNLDVLLRQRYSWMNDYIGPEDRVVELGCGPGFSRLYLGRGQLTLTDYINSEWVDEVVDAMDPPFEPNSIDVAVCSHMVHHMAHPVAFFKRMHALLRPGGRILIQDLNTALLMRLLLRVMRHEGWSYDVDVFDERVPANDASDPWSANCAIPELLFASADEFERRVPGYRVARNELNECLLFPLSGGVIAKTNVPELPTFALHAVAALDRVLVQWFPKACAMGRSVVLERLG
jgi:SAM-dependent methyltransferase